MKQGDIVNVYEDPITMQKLEGKAKLVCKICEVGQSKGFERWEVRFEGEVETYSRIIKEED